MAQQSTRTSTPMVLVHGFWHGSWCWSRLITELACLGRSAVAVDLLGHGLHARRPHWSTASNYDPEAVLSEVSPLAQLTLDDAAEHLASQLRRIGRGRPVTVVVHSASGLILSRVAQQHPELFERMIYLSAFMPASDVSPVVYNQIPEAAESRIVPLYKGDPADIGAIRLDVATDDRHYREEMREALYGDADPQVAEAALRLITPDVPVGFAFGTTTLTHDGWGSVPRTYLRCAADTGLMTAVQDLFIRDADDAYPDNPTSVETINSSHSPFVSMPADLAGLLTDLD